MKANLSLIDYKQYMKTENIDYKQLLIEKYKKKPNIDRYGNVDEGYMQDLIISDMVQEMLKRMNSNIIEELFKLGKERNKSLYNWEALDSI